MLVKLNLATGDVQAVMEAPGLHLNTIHNSIVTALQGVAIDIATGNQVWQGKDGKKAHDYMALPGGYVVLTEDCVELNGEIVLHRPGRFFRGLLCAYPDLWIGVNTFMKRGESKSKFEPPAIIRLNAENGKILEEHVIDLDHPWNIYGIVWNNWNTMEC